MWAILKKGVMERKPKNVDELWQFSQEEWVKIPLDTIKKCTSQYQDEFGRFSRQKGHTPNINFLKKTLF